MPLASPFHFSLRIRPAAWRSRRFLATCLPVARPVLQRLSRLRLRLRLPGPGSQLFWRRARPFRSRQFQLAESPVLQQPLAQPEPEPEPEPELRLQPQLQPRQLREPDVRL